MAIDLQLYNNAGNSLDLSSAVLERAMFHSDNVYNVPNMRIIGDVCYTNFPSNTAFRGFGGPQGMLIAENWIQRIAMELKKSPEEIRVRFSLLTRLSFEIILPHDDFSLSLNTSLALHQELNFQNEGCMLHYGQVLQSCTVSQLWDQLKQSCSFERARENVNMFNLHNRWRKRGVAMVPTKFGISFTTKFLNQVMDSLFSFQF